MIISAPLSPGDTIGIMAPSSAINPDRFKTSVDILQAQGYQVLIESQVYQKLHQSAGTVEQKLHAFHSMVNNTDVKAIWFASGGNRAAMLLPHLDMGLIRRNPKIMIGFSDATSLLNGIYQRTGLVTYHGPTVQSLMRMDADTQKAAFDLLAGATQGYTWKNTSAIHSGTVKGTMIGGCLSVFTALAGTGYMPDADGAILFLEDTNEEFSRIDRMLHHLKLALPFEKLGGIVLGRFLNPQDTGTPFGFTLEDIVQEHTQGLNIPVVMHAPFGHANALPVLPVGGKATLTVEASVTTLTF